MLRLGVLTAFLCCLPQLFSVKPLRRSRFQPNRSVTPRLRQASQRIIANLQPGNHTAIVRGVNNTTGVALVEVYELISRATEQLQYRPIRGKSVH